MAARFFLARSILLPGRWLSNRLSRVWMMPSGIEGAFAQFGRAPGSGVVVMPDAFATVHRKLIIDQAAVHHVPVIFPYRYEVVDGGLMAYGVDTVDLMRRAAPYVDRILKGDNPATLPVQPP